MLSTGWQWLSVVSQVFPLETLSLEVLGIELGTAKMPARRSTIGLWPLPSMDWTRLIQDIKYLDIQEK